MLMIKESDVHAYALHSICCGPVSQKQTPSELWHYKSRIYTISENTKFEFTSFLKIT